MVEAAILMSEGKAELALERAESAHITRPTCDVTYALEGSVRRLVGSSKPEASSEGYWVARAAGMVAGVLMIVAALALLTVPASISMGKFFGEGDRVFAEGQAVLPQFGYVAIVFGAMISAAVAIVAIARLRLFPTWLNGLSFVVAVLLALTSAMVSSMVLLPVWVILATVVLRRAPKELAP